jgi:hypothetical protein
MFPSRGQSWTKGQSAIIFPPYVHYYTLYNASNHREILGSKACIWIAQLLVIIVIDYNWWNMNQQNYSYTVVSSERYNDQHRESRHLFDRSVCKLLKVLLGKHCPDLLATTIDSIYYLWKLSIGKQSTLWTADTRGQDASSCFCK